ncbi:type II secretion system protein GspN [bacterium]|nr:type II secretion system protein GspN [candidate division CSSED10-310 bacterium]
MKRVIRYISRKIISWIVLPIIFFYLLMWIFNPAEYLVRHLTGQIEERTGIAIKYSDVQMNLMGSITLKQLTVQQTPDTTMGQSPQDTSDRKTFLSADYLSIRIAPTRLFEGISSLQFSGKAYDGTFSGSLESPIRKENAVLNVNLQWDAINLSLLSVDYRSLYLKTGISSGTARLKSDFSRTFSYEGPIDLIVEKTYLDFPQNMVSGFDIPEFNSLSARCTLNYDQIQFDDVRLNSPDTILRILGRIQQKIPADYSKLDLDVRIHLISDTQPFSEDMYIPVTVRGTANDPEILFLGRDVRKGLERESVK